ncbi:MAG TPA: hypothetical protein VJO36_03085, partial [Actinomycetota bacterium]|nr:hypothetical protein [Actinomycetota bacterium]
SGCIKLTMDLQVNSDDTVSGTIQLGIQKELLELSGGSVQDLLGSDSPFPSDAPGVTVEEFDDGEFAGQEFTFDSVPIAEFQATDDPDALSILRQGDVFVVSGVLDMSAASGATGGIGATGQELLDSAEIRITMTFPGDVQEATGTIDGNSVTWAPEFGERLEISATASAIDDGDAGDAGGGSGGSSTTIILIIVAVVVVGAIIAFFVMKGRKGGGSGDGEQAGFETAPAETPAETPSAPPATPAETPSAPPETPAETPSAPPATPAETPSAPPAPPAPPVPPAPPSE